MITVYLRGDIAERAAPCDVADVPVFAVDDGSPHGYIGAAWGSHEPDDVIAFAVCEPDDVDATLLSWGLRRAVEEAPNV